MKEQEGDGVLLGAQGVNNTLVAFGDDGATDG